MGKRLSPSVLALLILLVSVEAGGQQPFPRLQGPYLGAETTRG